MDRAVLEMVIQARQELAGLDATIAKIKEMKTTFTNTMKTMAAQARLFITSLQKMFAAIAKLQSAFRTLRNQALKAFTAIVAFTSTSVLKFFGDFEQAMANVNTLINVSQKQFQQLGDEVIAISNRIGEGAVALSTALYDIVSAGVSVNNAIAVLDVSARAARAGMTQTQTAVNAGLATINAYNLSIAELNRVYDLQFMTIKKGVLTYEQLAGSIGQVLPSAKKLNESLENLYGSLAFITKNGLSASEAAVSLARAFDGLTEKADKLAEVGVQVYDEFGKFRGILPIMEDLAERVKGLSDAEVNELLQNIGFDIRAARAIIPMIKNIEGLQDAIDSMAESSGAMEDAFTKATDTVQFHAGRAKEALINAVRNIGSIFGQEFRSFFTSISAWTIGIQNFIKNNKEAIKSVITFAIKLTGIVSVIGVVGAALLSLATPLGAVTAGVLVLASAWYLNLWDIRSVTQNVIDYVLQRWDELKTWWQDTTWLEKLQTIGEIAIEIGKWAWTSTVDIATSLWNWIKQQLDLDDDNNVTLREIIQVISNIGQWLWNNIGRPIKESLSNWVKNLLDLDKDGTITLDEILEVAVDVSVVLGSVIAGFTAIQLSKKIISAIASLGIAGLAAAGKVAGVAAAAISIGAILSIALDPEIENLEDWKQSFIEGLKYLFSAQFWQDLWTIAKYEWQFLWEDLTSWLGDLFKNFFTVDFWAGLWNNMVDSFKQAWNNIWSSVWTRVKQNEFIGNLFRGAYAQGGYVIGPGTGTSDSIPALLSNGEFVVNAKATKQWLPLLMAINSGNVPKFASGGHVGSNVQTLQSFGLQNNAILAYLAQIAHDTENFRHIVSLIAGIKELRNSYGDNMAELEKRTKELQDELIEQLQNLEDSTNNQTVALEQALLSLGQELTLFANNLSMLTGDSSAGLLAGIVQSGVQGWQAYNAFASATSIFGQVTAGIGMVNAALGAVAAFKMWNESQNEQQLQAWEEQLNISQQQLESMQAIEQHTRQTALDLVQLLAQNPTLSNIADTEKTMSGLWSALTGSLKPSTGSVSFHVVEDDLFFDDRKTVTYNPLDLMRRMGFDVAGSNLQDMSLQQLEQVYSMAKQVTSSHLRDIAQDIADTMDVFGSGELKSWSSTWSSFVSSLETYLNTVRDLETAMNNLMQSARYESFVGVEWVSAQKQVQAYREQLEKLYEAAGKDATQYADEIERAVNEYAENIVDGGERMITIMQTVRQGFIATFAEGNNMARGFVGYFDAIKQNIAGLFYDIQLDQLDAQFEAYFGSLIDKLASYTGSDVLGYFTQLMQSGDTAALFDQFISMYQSMEQIADINEIISEQLREQAKAAGMAEDEIEKMLQSLGLMKEEAATIRQRLTEIKNALQQAMTSALETGNIDAFSKSMGQAIYNNAKQGLIQAFMESEAYQQMFASWFEGLDISFTGNLAQDFETITGALVELEQQLGKAGMKFNYTDVATVGYAAASTGLYDSDSYFAPTTIEAATSIASDFKAAVEQFVSIVDGLLATVEQGIDRIVNAIMSTPKVEVVGSAQPVVIEEHYHFEPTIHNVLGTEDELFRKFVMWVNKQRKTQIYKEVRI